ncbi:ATP-dependent DNA helicase [Clostridium neuense]|uniref:ATP-dependent DNA helicase n=1 Tax=Clostridium neuense TaxID=1728934 RepID=A0ABW8TDC5_9CLOT
MSEDNKIKISIRNLVEFVMRSGSIDNRFQGMGRALEGTKIHGKFQRENKKLYEGIENCKYSKEVYLKYETEYKGVKFLIDGRADEIIEEENRVIINEIKSTGRSLESIDENYNELHWAQAKCYGYMYSEEKKLDNVNIRLTYINADSYENKQFEEVMSHSKLKEYFFDILDKYIVWAHFIQYWTAKRNSSMKEFKFPFHEYRSGQRELAVRVYKAVQKEKKAFIKAPTGIGKTMSVIFPAVKAMGEEINERIFYLTAKGTHGKAPEAALEFMRSKGLKVKSITITSKEKICFNDKVSCNPEGCEFAKGHYDRVNEAILDIINNEDNFARGVIEEYAKKYKLCPFEFSLDLTLWSDIIICDYNYVFDPAVYLKRFFSENGGNYTFLIDEAHNLVDRARDMFSKELLKSTVMSLKKNIKNKKSKIYKVLDNINKVFISIRKSAEEKNTVVSAEIPDDLLRYVYKFTVICEEWLIQNSKDEIYEDVLQFYFDCISFIRIAEFYDDKFVFYGEKFKNEFKVKLFCLDPSKLISEALKRGKSAVFFSATLEPLNYYKEMFGANDEDYAISLKSPFPSENKCVLIGNRISTKYVNREKSYKAIAEYINSMVSEKIGNYMVFFPSYKYMNEVYSIFLDEYSHNTIIQNNSMDEAARVEFIDKFNNKEDEEVIGFCVMGGVFSEGIDLAHDKLIGAIIVGVGLPQICMERDLIKEYFNKKNNFGYKYAYMYPGINKVLQSAGRVIRTENDRGIIMLLDERFGTNEYISLFEKDLYFYHYVKNKGEIEKNAKNFWEHI